MEKFNDLADFSALEIKELLTLACKLDEKPEPRALEGKVLSLLFLSPSLRTLASFPICDGPNGWWHFCHFTECVDTWA